MGKGSEVLSKLDYFPAQNGKKEGKIIYVAQWGMEKKLDRGAKQLLPRNKKL